MDLVDDVTRAYHSYSVDQLRRVHSLIHVVFHQTLENLGYNQFSHRNKTRQTSGEEVDNRTVSNDIIRTARE